MTSMKEGTSAQLSGRGKLHGGARVTTLVTLRSCTLGNKREIKTLKFVSASTKGFKGGLAWIKPSKKDMAVTFSYYSYTLPLIEDMLQKQHRRRIFTVIDLKHGYHQMPLAEESRACTAMSTPLGPLQWKVMPMGATNGNAAFQWMLENLLEPLRDCADPFVDDVIIASGDPSMSYEELLEAHERDVTRVLDLLVRHKLTGSSDKATIAVSEVVFAGHVVGNGQRKPIPGKVAAIEHWEKPKTSLSYGRIWGSATTTRGISKCMPSMQPP